MTTYDKLKKIEEMMEQMGIHFESWTNNTIVVVDGFNREEYYLLDELNFKATCFPTSDDFTIELKDTF